MAITLNAAAILFRAAAAGAVSQQCGKVVAVDRVKRTATVEMVCRPTHIRFVCDGELKGLLEGDYFEFHLDKDCVKWKDGQLKIRKIDFDI